VYVSFIDASVTDMFFCVQKIARNTLDCINALSIECTIVHCILAVQRIEKLIMSSIFLTLHFRFFTLSFISLSVLCVHINA